MISDKDINNNPQILRSDDINEIITKVPPWILRRGITLYFAVFTSIFLITAWIPYPDVINGDIQVESSKGIVMAQMVIPQENFAQVKVGQEVLIKLKSYPFEDYGILKGKINSIADEANGNMLFQLSVQVSKGAISDFGRNIALKKGMTGNGEIVIQKITLLQRILRSIYKNI